MGSCKEGLILTLNILSDDNLPNRTQQAALNIYYLVPYTPIDVSVSLNSSS